MLSFDPEADAGSGRSVQAVAVGAIAILLIGIAGAVYLRSSVTPKSTAQGAAAHESIRPAGQIVDYDFLSATLGWAVSTSVSVSEAGSFSIFRTTDGAKHWKRQLSAATDFVGATVGSLHMLDPNHGFAVGGHPLQLYRTRDGGSHWTGVPLPTVDTLQVIFSDVRAGLLATRPGGSHAGAQLYVTHDGGDSWARLPDPPLDAYLFQLSGGSEAWAGSMPSPQPHVYMSSDFGLTWTERDIPRPPRPLSLDPISTFVRLLPGAGVVATLSSANDLSEATSFDGGSSWRLVTSPAISSFYARYWFEDSHNWWEVSGSVLYKSADAGQSWAQIADDLPPALNPVQIIDSRHAWAWFSYPDGASLTETSDGGRTWTPATVPST